MARPRASFAKTRKAVERNLILWSACTASVPGSDSKLLPADLPGPEHVTDLSFAVCEGRRSGLDLEKHYSPQLTRVQTIKDNQIDRGAEKASILGAKRELWQVGQKLLVDLTGDRGLAALNRILPNPPSVSGLPEEHIDTGQKQAQAQASHYQEQRRQETQVRHESSAR